jgi:large subunit ribosomal protein L5
MSYEPRLKKKYREEVASTLKERFEYSSGMQIPKLLKISVNQGVGAATQDKKLADAAVEQLTLITGQQAVKTLAKKSISNFKLRDHMPIGAKVTLRGDQMWEFLDRLIAVALPRVRDFRGVSNKSFDGRGNYTMGITEQIIFPEIDLDKVGRINGMDVTFVTSAPTDNEAFELLKELGVPFKK